MTTIEIVTIICCVSIVGCVIASYIYKKIKRIPTGECACCKSNMKRAVKKMKKECCCNK